jgi:hypothetical protein
MPKQAFREAGVAAADIRDAGIKQLHCRIISMSRLVRAPV